MQTLSKAREILTKRGADLQPRMVQLAENIHVAVNYTVSTVTMIEGENGIVLIDAGQDVRDCEDIYAEFRKITDKPLLGIVYTHGHPDHTMGVGAFLPNGNEDNKVEIWGRDNFNAENKQFAELSPIFGKRGTRQGGFLLPPEKRINNGIAPVKFPKTGNFNSKAKPIFPNHTFKDSAKIKIDTIELELYAAPGETADQLYVWYPAHKILFSGDNMYRSFPNLYAIRGAGYRDVRAWVKAIEEMIALEPEAIVLGHTLPVTSKEEGKSFMADYHEALKFVYDKSIEGMNLGLTIDELAEYVKLPAHLAEKDYLVEYYGNVEWSVRAIFVGHLGWFDGNGHNLVSFTVKEKAERMARLVGGEEALLKAAKDALASGDAKWSAELCDHCIALNLPAEETKIEALEILAENLLSATGRNYIFTEANQMRQALAEKSK